MCDRCALCLFCFTKYFDVHLCIGCAYGVSNLHVCVVLNYFVTCETVNVYLYYQQKASMPFSHLPLLHRGNVK